MAKTEQLPMRIALRQEDDFWRAYLANRDTMAGALLMGSIRLSAVHGNPKRRQAFIDLMTSFLAEAIEEATGAKPTWIEEEPAPKGRTGDEL